MNLFLKVWLKACKLVVLTCVVVGFVKKVLVKVVAVGWRAAILPRPTNDLCNAVRIIIIGNEASKKKKRRGRAGGLQGTTRKKCAVYQTILFNKKIEKKVKDLCNNKPGLNLKMIKLTGMGFCFKNRRVDYDSKTTVTLFFQSYTEKNTKGISDLIRYFKVQL